MSRALTVRLNPPWTDLHDRRGSPPQPVNTHRTASAGERAMSSRRAEARLEALRERTFRELTMCSRPYL